MICYSSFFIFIIFCIFSLEMGIPVVIWGEAGNGDGEEKPPMVGIEDRGGKYMGWRGRGVRRHFPPPPCVVDIPISFSLRNMALPKVDLILPIGFQIILPHFMWHLNKGIDEEFSGNLNLQLKNKNFYYAFECILEYKLVF